MATSQERGSNSESGVKSRIVLQQCLSARLMVQPATEQAEPQFVQIGRGLVLYLCFLKGASAELLDKMVRSALGARLSETGDGKLVSVLDLPGDILIVPQATLGGSLKGKMMQYHRNIAKDTGSQLYSDFVHLCEDMVSKSARSQEEGSVVKWGTYGNRQVLSLDTNGPYTHLLEF